MLKRSRRACAVRFHIVLGLLGAFVMKVVVIALATFLAAAVAHASTVSWVFSGSGYEGPDTLGGDVVVTLDDENTAKTVKIMIDASGIDDPNQYIRYLYLNTTFDSSAAGGVNSISVEGIGGSAGGSYASRTNNEDGLIAGAGGGFDFRLNFFEDGTQYFSEDGIFTATLRQNANDLLVSSFLGELSSGSTVGPIEAALLIRTPTNITTPASERTSTYFAGERLAPIPIPASLPLFLGGFAFAGFILRGRKQKDG